MNPPRNKVQRRMSALCLGKLIAAMQDGPHTVYELAEITGLHKNTVRAYVLSIHAEQAAHIAEWSEDARGYRTIPAYILSPGKDVKRPKMDEVARRAKWREKERQRRLMLKLAGNDSQMKEAA